MNRKRKSDCNRGITGSIDEELTGQVGGHESMVTDAIESITEPSGLEPETPTSAPVPDQQVIFVEPLLPPAETPPTIVLQQSEVSEYPYVPPRDDRLLSYESAIPDAGIIVDTADPGELDIETSSQQPISEEIPAEEPCTGDQVVSAHVQDIPSEVWRSVVSPVSSTSGSDSASSNSALSSCAPSHVTTGANTASSPTLTISTATSSTGTSTNTTYIQPQFQVPYYMPPPFSVPYTQGQPPFLIPGPYSPIPYPLRPPFTYGTPPPGPFQAYQYAPVPPPPGQVAPYTLRPYPYPPWAPYANGFIDTNWFESSAQTQLQTQVQLKPQRAKRGWGIADQLAPSEDGLRIVMVQPKSFHDVGNTSPADSVPPASAAESRTTQTVSESHPRRPPRGVAGSPRAELSSAKWRAASANSTGAVSFAFTLLYIAASLTAPWFSL